MCFRFRDKTLPYSLQSILVASIIHTFAKQTFRTFIQLSRFHTLKDRSREFSVSLYTELRRRATVFASRKYEYEYERKGEGETERERERMDKTGDAASGNEEKRERDSIAARGHTTLSVI